MPWRTCRPMDERLRFIARLLEGEKMAPLCREFGISRVTGYKIYERYKECGLEGLSDRSRRPYRHANELPYQVERTILGIKKEHASWGAPKIRDKPLWLSGPRVRFRHSPTSPARHPHCVARAQAHPLAAALACRKNAGESARPARCPRLHAVLVEQGHALPSHMHQAPGLSCGSDRPGCRLRGVFRPRLPPYHLRRSRPVQP